MSEVMQRRSRGPAGPVPADTVRLWWLRHGPVPGAETGRISGQADLACDLSDQPTLDWLRGVLPAEALFIASPLRRAQESGQAALGHAPELTDPALMEQNFGQWTRQRWADLGTAAQEIGFWDDPATVRPPEGESFLDQCQRVGGWIEQARQTYGGREVVVACHGGTIRAALAHALAQAQGLPTAGPDQAKAVLSFVIDTLSLTRMQLFAQGAAILSVNERAPQL
jgi:alpha-ribazole phosphatase